MLKDFVRRCIGVPSPCRMMDHPVRVILQSDRRAERRRTGEDSERWIREGEEAAAAESVSAELTDNEIN